MIKNSAQCVMRTASIAVISMTMAPAHAQDAPSQTDSNSAANQDIVVTAMKTGATRLQATPLAISAFTSDQLAQTQSMNVKDLAQFTPSVNISQVTTSPIITIRGIGTNNVFNGSDPDVTEQVDGVYIARPSSQTSDFLDIERVEILRGPQGTLYGRNAVGGTINIISRAPSDTFKLEQALTGGNFALFQDQTYVSGPINPGLLQVSAAITYARHDDYEKNIAPGAAQSGTQNGNHGGARIQVRLAPADGIDATTRLDYSRRDEDLENAYHLLAPFPGSPLGNTILGDYSKVAIDSPSITKQTSKGVAEEINVRLADWISLKSLTAYRKTDYSLFTDNDGTPATVMVGHMEEHEHQFSQEFDLTGRIGRLDFVSGLYYFSERDASVVNARVLAANLKIQSTPVTKSRSEAVFSQGTYHITDTLSFTAGLRYTKERKFIDVDFDRSNLATGVSLPGFPILFTQTRHYHALTPKFGLDWKVTPTTFVYASVTRGYKSGGVNYATTNPITASFNPEHIWSYEIGAKTDLFDRRLRFNISAFHYDYSDLQIQATIAPGIVSIANAATAKVNGVEIETTARIVSNFSMNANLSYLHARYGNFTKAAVPAALAPYLAGDPNFNVAAGTYDASGNRLNQAPTFSGTVAAEYDYTLASGAKFYARGDVYFQGKVFYDPSNSVYQEQPAYHLFNASVGYNSPGGRWKAQLWAKNLANKQYLIAIQANGVEPAGYAAPPRTFGIRLSYSM
jgi:iron complex outermembrane receptor protein